MSQTKHQLLELLEKQAVRIASLEADHQILRTQTAVRPDSPSNAADPNPLCSPSTAASVIERHLAQDEVHTLLQQKYDALKKQHAGCEERLRGMIGKYESAKAIVQQWHAYFVKQRARRSEHTHKINSSEDHQVQHENSTRAKLRVPVLVERTMQQVHDYIELPPLSEDRLGRTSDSVSRHRASSQTTVSDEEPSKVKELEQCDDGEEPCVVSERQLKRRRLNKRSRSPRIKQESGSASQPMLLSTDELDTTPLPRPKRRHEELSDLDIATVPALSSGETIVPYDKTDSIESPRQISTLLHHVEPPSGKSTVRQHDHSASNPRERHSILGTIDTNIPTPKKSPATTSRLSGSAREHERLAMLAEDGTAEWMASRAANKTSPMLASRVSINELLELPSPYVVPLPSFSSSSKRRLPHQKWFDKENISPFVPQRSSRQQRENLAQTEEQSRAKAEVGNVSMDDTAKEKPYKSLIKRTGHKPHTRSVQSRRQSRATPLRSLPVDSLQIEDFRPNPTYQGPGHSFIGPLSRDTGRTCLPGCTRPNCCGSKHRRMIELGGKEVTGKTDREVLEDYLGPEYAEIMAVYGPEKRDELVLQAHAAAFAKNTKAPTTHRTRPPTPPDHWRMDMLNTQELAENHQKAHEMERRNVAERRHEALRPGGQWLFRDEVV